MWSVLALPLLSCLYVRAKALPTIDPRHRPEFRTKLVFAVELLLWAKSWLSLLGKPLWVLTDGLCKGRLPQVGASVGDDDRQLTPQGLSPAHSPRAPTARTAWPAPPGRRTPHRPGQAGRPATWLVDR
jgi:hypothetical protein